VSSAPSCDTHDAHTCHVGHRGVRGGRATAADCWQCSPDSRQQTADSRQQTADSRQQTALHRRAHSDRCHGRQAGRQARMRACMQQGPTTDKSDRCTRTPQNAVVTKLSHMYRSARSVRFAEASSPAAAAAAAAAAATSGDTAGSRAMYLRAQRSTAHISYSDQSHVHTRSHMPARFGHILRQQSWDQEVDVVRPRLQRHQRPERGTGTGSTGRRHDSWAGSPRRAARRPRRRRRVCRAAAAAAAAKRRVASSAVPALGIHSLGWRWRLQLRCTPNL
jgi:hypothetical protein